MYQTMEIYMARKRKVPQRFVFLSDSVKYLSEPICHVETADTIHKQMEWWPNGEQPVSRHKPLYDRLTTQRSDYQSLVFCNHPTRHGSNPHMYPMCGIVPLASPKGRTRLPKLLQEEISYIHKYDSRLTPNEPIRGKRHGAFVWREIKTDSGPVVPQGTKRFLNATGSHSLEQPQTGKGNSVESSMTSPKLCVHSSQQMFNSESHLSKTDLREAAKTYARNTAREQSSPGGSQTAKSQSLVPIGELVSSRPTEKPL
ncbi:ciliary microtubule inner protein 6 isoform 2-T2 [Discoglossus pictus]